jgi:hypothetical protein
LPSHLTDVSAPKHRDGTRCPRAGAICTPDPGRLLLVQGDPARVEGGGHRNADLAPAPPLPTAEPLIEQSRHRST